MSTLDTILSFLQGKGLSKAQAAGVAGNFQVESGLDPNAANPKEHAIGLAQWEGGRRTNLQAYARAHGGTETDLSMQLGYLWQELSGPESDALQRLSQTTDAGTAAAVFDQYFERSSGAARATRVTDAKAIYGGTDPTTNFLGKAKDAVTGAVSDAADALNPFDNWKTDAGNLAMKVGAVSVAGALVVAGAVHTVK